MSLNASPRGLASVKVSNTTGAGNGFATVAVGVWQKAADGDVTRPV